jgi:DNA uptake protein ComE-like DNA-binding protein
LNSADESELENVGGLGRERARRLVQARPFCSWEAIKKVDGFSDKLVEDLQNAGARLG